MKRNYSKKLFLGLAFVLAFTYGCKKNEKIDVDQDSQAAQDNAQAEYVLSNVNGIVDDAARSQGGVNKMEVVCPNVEILNPTSFPRTMILTFDSTCTKDPKDNKIKSGKIKVVYSKNFLTTGATKTTTFENFKMNGYSVEGTLLHTNNGNGKETFVVTDAKITTSAGNWVKLSGTHTKEVLSVDSLKKEKYQLKGSTKGESETQKYTATISETKPVIVDNSTCDWPQSGEITIKIEGKETERVIDFGDGTCDSKMDITIGKIKSTMNLK